MEKLIRDIEAYALAAGRKPQWVLRTAAGYGWGVWDQWVARTKSPTVDTADRIYAFMADNPPGASQAKHDGRDAA